MSNFNIKIPAGLNMMAGTILEPEVPTADSLKNDIFALCMSDDVAELTPVIKGLVNAYVALAEFNDEDEDMVLVSDSDDWAAEKVYIEYAIKGWRQAVGREYPEAAKSRDDERVYESCPWYDFGKMTWPAQLIAEVGYLVGYKAGREGVAMSRYFEQQEAANV